MIRYIFLAMALIVVADSADAQSTAPPDPSSESQVVFLPDYAFHLNMEHLSDEDPRYVWEANYGGELGIVAVGTTRLAFVVNYQAILGEEFHAFDPNQGNYILEGDVTTIVRGFEVGGIFYHQSRHLADRPKRQPVDWNMLGGRIRKRVVHGPSELDVRLDLRGSILTTYVDYNWELDAGVKATHRLRPALQLVGGFNVRHFGVDGSRGRDGPTGVRGEGGFRVTGRAAAVELFLAVERRIDPYPLEFGSETWASVGMRLLSR